MSNSPNFKFSLERLVGKNSLEFENQRKSHLQQMQNPKNKTRNKNYSTRSSPFHRSMLEALPRLNVTKNSK